MNELIVDKSSTEICTHNANLILHKNKTTKLKKKTKLRGLSPQANYTDRATAAVGEVVPTFCG
jgi:hypothetical protein